MAQPDDVVQLNKLIFEMHGRQVEFEADIDFVFEPCGMLTDIAFVYLRRINHFSIPVIVLNGVPPCFTLEPLSSFDFPGGHGGT